MAKISRPEDAYRTLVEESDENWLSSLLAFAIMEERRIEWAQHFHSNSSRSPSETENQHWYEQQPEGELLRARAQAEKSLEEFANEIWYEFSEQEKKVVAEGVLANEIRSVRRLWPQLGISIAGGLVSAIVFAVILAVLAMVILQNPSPIEMSRSILGEQGTEAPSGKTDGE